MKKIKVGDVVRVIPDSYFNLCKGSMNNPSVWKKSTGFNDESVMLGGRYVVMDVHESLHGIFYDLILDKNDPFRDDFVILEEEVQDAPFRVGDEVLFRPKCSEQEIRFLMNLTAFKSLQNPNYLHEIKYILNDYYLFIDVGADSKYAFPMRWVDFEKA